MTPATPLLTLNNGVELPALGLGVFQTPPEETRDAVRADVFVETKIWISDYGYDETLHALGKSAGKLDVEQIECHPYFAQQPVQDVAAENGILTQAWSPIGGITFYRDGNHGSTLDDPTNRDIASAHGKTAAQVMLRWGLQHGRSVIPKSTKPSRIAENIDVFDFELSDEHMTAIDGLDTGRRGGPEPDAITLEAFGREIPEA
jgi:diketogulonate reductase-like aldo/keto reductase